MNFKSKVFNKKVILLSTILIFTYVPKIFSFEISSNANSQFEIFKFKISSDFGKALELKKNEDPNGESNAESEESSLFVPAFVFDNKSQKTLQARIKARGNSILSDPRATFPKLKIEIADSEDLKGTDFQNNKKFRLNTHVSHSNAKYTGYGRLIGNNNPFREGLAYRISEVLGLVAPITQFAEVTYFDQKQKKEFTNKALMLETDNKIAKRLNGQIINEFDASPGDLKVSPLQAARIMVFHKLIGNEDFSLKVYEKDVMQTGKYRAYWNTFLIKLQNNETVPVVYDLDLATIVTNRNAELGKKFINNEFDLRSAQEALFVSRFMKLRQKLKKEDLLIAINEIKSKQSQIIEVISQSPIDEKGKKIALNHLQIFLNNVDRCMSFDLITSEEVRFYSKPDGRSVQKTIHSPSGGKAVLRPGTPIKVLNQTEDFYQVAILDIHQDLASGQSPIGYIKKTTPIAKDLSESLLGWLDERDL